MINWNKYPIGKMVQDRGIVYFKINNITSEIEMTQDVYRDGLVIFTVYKLGTVAVAYTLKTLDTFQKKVLIEDKLVFVSYTSDIKKSKLIKTVYYDDNVRFLKFGDFEDSCYIFAYKIKQSEYYVKTNGY